MSRDQSKTRKIRNILKVLSTAAEPLSGLQIAEEMENQGISISERTVRIYLQETDDEGLTESHGKRGRTLTQQGRLELESNDLFSRVGYMSAKIDRMTFKMTFDLEMRSGSVVINSSLIPIEAFREHWHRIYQVFEKGYAMGTLMNILPPGSTLGSFTVPEGFVGFCTVCSVTLNGVLLKKGVPVRSLFSGLLELKDSKATFFSDLIYYDATSLDPLELFIKSRLTNYLGAIRNGQGRIGAGFREIPAESYDLVKDLAGKLGNIGLGAFYKIGRPSTNLLNIPVREGSCGVIVVGGLNPVSIFEESGVNVTVKALSGLMEFNSLFPYTELESRLNSIK